MINTEGGVIGDDHQKHIMKINLGGSSHQNELAVGMEEDRHRALFVGTLDSFLMQIGLTLCKDQNERYRPHQGGRVVITDLTMERDLMMRRCHHMPPSRINQRIKMLKNTRRIISNIIININNHHMRRQSRRRKMMQLLMTKLKWLNPKIVREAKHPLLTQHPLL